MYVYIGAFTVLTCAIQYDSLISAVSITSGVTDLSTLATCSQKFEYNYMDKLVYTYIHIYIHLYVRIYMNLYRYV